VPWPVYSERFIATEDVRLWRYWSCPGGMRAVVKQVSVSNTWNVACVVHVQIGAHHVGIFNFPATIDSKSLQTMTVVYAGETLGVFNDGPNASTMVSGYLFRDVTGRTSPPAGAGTHPEWQPPRSPFRPTPHR
jgi:hypothetical protein